MDFRATMRRTKKDHRRAVVTALYELAFNGFIIIRNRDRPNEVGEIVQNIGPGSSELRGQERRGR
jgi:hypothetical protein